MRRGERKLETGNGIYWKCKALDKVRYCIVGAGVHRISFHLDEAQIMAFFTKGHRPIFGGE